MIFAYPLGLLGLIAVPVLIAIYIIKNRYTEQTITSTYIWNLSEKFLKRRVPISKVVGIISLILQILIVILISFLISQPVITIANSANSYCFILDGSGSMNYVQDGQTRFDIAKDEIADIIDDSMNGSEYTLIYSGNTTETIFENETDKKAAKQILSELSVDYVSVDVNDAIKAAQVYFEKNPSVLTYLFTDENYVTYENVNIVNVATSAVNYALSGVNYTLSGNQLQINGKVISYESAEEVTIELFLNGSDEIYDSLTLIATQSGVAFEFVCEVSSFESFTLSIANEDGLVYDNEVIVFNPSNETVTDILIVSDSPFFIKTALSAAGFSEVQIITTKEFSAQSGYGLYIFDTFMPNALPDDGAVWFINPIGSLAGTNFSYQSEVDAPEDPATYSTSTASTVNKLLEGVLKREFQVRKYAKCGLNGRFTTLISSEKGDKGDPLLFVGNNSFGNRQVVFTFDLHDSAEFTLMGDFPTLVKNLIEYSFPAVVDKTSYICGDVIEINMVTGVNNIIIQTPAGRKVYTDPYVAVSEYQLTEVGVYSIILEMKDKSERVLNIYSEIPEEERLPLTTGNSFIISGEADNKKLIGYLEILLYLFIAVVVLAVADYGVYCYEQYQLR